MADHDDDPARVGGVGRARGATAPDAAEPIAAAVGTDGVEAIAPAALGGTEAIAQALAAGQIDVEAATRDLIAQSVVAALGPGADPAQVDALRAEVEALLVGDPMLAELLRGA